MPLLKLKDVIDKMEQIEDSTEFDGWDAWIELKEWFVKQKPPEADGLANWDDAEQSVHPTAFGVCPHGVNLGNQACSACEPEKFGGG